MTPYPAFHKHINDLESLDLLRDLKSIGNRHDKWITYKGKKRLNLSSNDYLGLATKRSLAEEFYARLNTENLISSYGLSASSSRLLTGNSTLYEALEKKLSRFYDGREALVFNSGYHANIGIIPALAGKEDLILSDSLNHASIVDGIRLSRARCIIFRHNDTDHLRNLLENEAGRYKNILIITESVFSMDGDRARIKELVGLKEEFNALLYVDEAHSVGVMGNQGQGMCHACNCHQKVDVLLGTLGKAMASHGAYSIVHPTIKALLINRMRSLLYTTALPPVAVTWNLFVLEQLPRLDKERKKLATLSSDFRKEINNHGLSSIGDTHIIPVITHSNESAVNLSEHLIKNGFLVFAIRPPTVPENNSRLRFSLTSDIDFAEIQAVPSIIKDFLKGESA